MNEWQFEVFFRDRLWAVLQSTRVTYPGSPISFSGCYGISVASLTALCHLRDRIKALLSRIVLLWFLPNSVITLHLCALIIVGCVSHTIRTYLHVSPRLARAARSAGTPAAALFKSGWTMCSHAGASAASSLPPAPSPTSLGVLLVFFVRRFTEAIAVVDGDTRRRRLFLFVFSFQDGRNWLVGATGSPPVHRLSAAQGAAFLHTPASSCPHVAILPSLCESPSGSLS